MKKILTLLALVLCLSIAAGCSSSKRNGKSDDSAVTAADAKTAAANTTEASETPNLIDSGEALAKELPNYSCKIYVTTNDSEVSILSYKVHPDGVVFKPSSTEDSLMVYDIKNKKIYILNETEKTGISMADNNKSSSFVQPATYFMAWGDIDKSLLKKVSSVTIDGRKAIMYTHSMAGVEVRYAIDKEYGFCLSYEMIENGKTSSKWEMKDFKVGDVSAADVKVPADYKVSELPS